VPDFVIAAASLVLAASLAWAASAKALYWASWRAALTSYALPNAAVGAVALAVPAIELVLVALMLSGALLVGAALTVLMLAAFSLAVLRATMLHRSNRLPCGCFGRMKTRDYRFLIVRNGFLGALAALVLIGNRNVDPVGGMGGASPASAAWVLLAAVLIALCLHLGRRAALTARKRLHSSTR
jgi:hypothetical protein